jgi:hypothetical protein
MELTNRVDMVLAHGCVWKVGFIKVMAVWGDDMSKGIKVYAIGGFLVMKTE